MALPLAPALTLTLHGPKHMTLSCPFKLARIIILPSRKLIFCEILTLWIRL